MIRLASYLTESSENLTLTAIAVKKTEINSGDSKIIKILSKVDVLTKLLA